LSNQDKVDPEADPQVDAKVDPEEHAVRLLKECIRSTEPSPAGSDVDGEASGTASAPLNLSASVKRLNQATTLLFRILSVLNDQWHPDAKLPIVTPGDLDKSVKDASDAIEKLILANISEKEGDATRTGIIHGFGKGVKAVCVHLKPFLRNFLTVGVTANAVQPLFLGP
jgi:hypothetical protein